MKHIVHNWGDNISSIHDGIGPPFVILTKKNEIFHEKKKCSEWTKMQNKHNFFFLVLGDPTLGEGALWSNLAFFANSKISAIEFFWSYYLVQNWQHLTLMKGAIYE